MNQSYPFAVWILNNKIIIITGIVALIIGLIIGLSFRRPGLYQFSDNGSFILNTSTAEVIYWAGEGSVRYDPIRGTYTTKKYSEFPPPIKKTGVASLPLLEVQTN